MSIGDDLNPWPAFADMLFMLFVLSIVSAAAITDWALDSESKLRGCGSSKVFMEGFAECVDVPPSETESACKVSLEEARLRFQTSDTRLRQESQLFGQSVADCLAKSLIAAAISDDAQVFDSIEFVSIDGHTDCVGSDVENLRLGSGRALTLYEMFLTAVDTSSVAGEPLPADLRAAVLSKVTIRSFGKSRPLPDSPCAQDTERGRFAPFDADRRVEIAVNSRLMAN